MPDQYVMPDGAVQVYPRKWCARFFSESERVLAVECRGCEFLDIGA